MRLTVVRVVVGLLLLVCKGQETLRQRNRRLIYFGFLLDLFAEKPCPPNGFDALDDLDVESYISARWYTQRAIQVAYSSGPTSYCTTADYTSDTSFCFLYCKLPRFLIANRGREGSVTGDRVGEDPDSNGSPFFRGIVVDPPRAKVSVGPLAQLARISNYWVVAAGTYQDAADGTHIPSSNVYKYAIITGGAPTKRGNNGLCRPNPGIFNLRGMWLFTRDRVPSDQAIADIEAVAESLGLDISAWDPVVQEGCDN